MRFALDNVLRSDVYDVASDGGAGIQCQVKIFLKKDWLHCHLSFLFLTKHDTVRLCEYDANLGIIKNFLSFPRQKSYIIMLIVT